MKESAYNESGPYHRLSLTFSYIVKHTGVGWAHTCSLRLDLASILPCHAIPSGTPSSLNGKEREALMTSPIEGALKVSHTTDFFYKGGYS